MTHIQQSFLSECRCIKNDLVSCCCCWRSGCASTSSQVSRARVAVISRRGHKRSTEWHWRCWLLTIVREQHSCITDVSSLSRYMLAT